MSALMLIALLLSLHVAMTDLYARRVSNLALALALLAGLACCLLPGSDHSLPQALVGLGVGFLALLPFHLIRWMGAGDVKYFATLGFLLGMVALPVIWIVASLVAGLHAVLVIVARTGQGARRSIPRPLRLARVGLHRSRAWRTMRQARQGRRGIPYAAYMSLGTGGLILHNSGGSHV